MNFDKESKSERKKKQQIFFGVSVCVFVFWGVGGWKRVSGILFWFDCFITMYLFTKACIVRVVAIYPDGFLEVMAL